jgi:3-oxoadipate enol-lactonase
MPRIALNGANLYYEDSGSNHEAIIFAHGLLWSGRMFAAQVAALKDRYRCITFDFRGQGQSEITAAGYDMDTLAEDAAAVIDSLGVAPCHFLGLSMGGFVGMRLAARRPELIRSLMLLETSADAEPPENIPRYKLLSFIARWLSMRLVTDKVMGVMFGQKFLTDATRARQREEWRQRLFANDRVGTNRATHGVITRQPVYEEIAKIRAPTLVVVGDQDVATSPEKARRIHERIRGSKLRIIPGAGHTSTVEEPAAINAALEQFLAEVSS